MSIVPATDERLKQKLSLALGERSAGWADLVYNSNALLYVMRENGQFTPYSGPEIYERLLYNEGGNYSRIAGYDLINTSPAELFNSAVFTPKMAFITFQLSGDEITDNAGENQMVDIVTAYMEATEQEMLDRFTEDLHSNGTADGGLQFGGLQLIAPSVVNSGTYGGISRTNAVWQTRSYDADSAFSGITTVDKASVYQIFETITIDLSAGTRGPNMILASQQHFQAYSAANRDIQRITNSQMSQLGFTNLVFFGAGRQIPIILEGGQGSAMPDNVTYFLRTENLRFRYNPSLYFSKVDDMQMPINQYAYVQKYGIKGEFVMNNPRHIAKLFETSV